MNRVIDFYSAPSKMNAYPTYNKALLKQSRQQRGGGVNPLANIGAGEALLGAAGLATILMWTKMMKASKRVREKGY